MLHDKPTYDELAERVAKLEGRKLTLGDLPLRPLQDRLEYDWRPNPAVLLPAASVTEDRLALPPGAGSGVVTWAGGTPRAGNLAVTHGMGRVPRAAVAVCSSSLVGGTVFPVLAAFNLTATTFSVSAVTSDGSSPLAATTANFFWIAV